MIAERRSAGRFVLCVCAIMTIACLTARAFGQTRPAVASDDAIARAMGQPFYSGAILPTPRRVTYSDEALVLLDGPKRVDFCEPMVEYFGPARDLLIRLLNGRLDAYRKQFGGEWRPPDKSQRLAILVTLAGDENAQYLLDAYKLGDKAKSLEPQGYLLEVGSRGVLCAGKDNQGLVNALASLLQLVHVKDGRLCVRRASIVDSPTFTTRYTGEYGFAGEEFLDWMALYKVNGFATCYPATKWQGLTDAHRQGMKTVGDYAGKYGTLDYMVQFHVGGRRNRPVDCGSDKDVATFLATLAETIRLSRPRHIMLCYDDVLEKLQPEERGKFERPAQAHGSLVDRVYKHVQKLQPGTIVSFCPPYYQGFQHRKWRSGEELREKGLTYLKDTRTWNPNVRLVWTGPVTESKVITMDDIDKYREAIGKDRPLFYWDNTWHYHQPLRNFHSRYPKDFVLQCADRTGYINLNGTQPIGRFFAATASDYYWNPEAFDSKRARKEAVAQFMGPPAVPVAERFYEFRGDGYMVYFSRMADLSKFEGIVRALGAVSWDAALTAVCRAGYEQVAKVQKKR
ncbi:MAG: beta-N-acetylglucosaminidase domain-containing protein [Phycisphaerae bacterium]|nr:beta-N-acetylglucosaminidase domain-containing protein [Phycisphaerae bacterium]